VAGLNPGGQRPAGDDGTADPHLVAVLARYAAGQESEPAMLTALAGARLLVPLVERPADAGPSPGGAAPGETGDAAGETGDESCDHETAGCDHRMAREMAFPALIGRDGRPALLAFTSLPALVNWRPEARPVPTPAGQVWGSATGSQCAVVIDVAGPVPVAVDGARLAALAAGEPPPEPHADPDIRAGVAAALAATPARPDVPVIAGANLAPGRDGTDLAVRLLVQPTAATEATGFLVQEAVQQAAEAIAARLAGRLRRGIEFSAAPAAPATRPRG
jgi:type III secretion system (T3SS) SseB-like protein